MSIGCFGASNVDVWVKLSFAEAGEGEICLSTVCKQ